MLSLCTAPVDTRQTIKWCFLDDPEHMFTEALGLVQGAEVKVLDSCWGGVVVSVGGTCVALGREIAERIKV